MICGFKGRNTMISLAINGFGRIGRTAFKIAVNKADVQIVAINDLAPAETLAYLLRYDSNYGVFEGDVSYGEDCIIVNGKQYQVYKEKDPSLLPWEKLGVDVVLECTGLFLDAEKAGMHLKAGAKKVVVSAPPKGQGIQTFVMGVNHLEAKKVGSNIYSNASCTTNCIAPVAHVIHEVFGIRKAMMTTIHAYTADQSLQDGPHRDLRRGRSAAQNIVPTTTGAAKAVGETVPALKGIFDGLAIRVPVSVGSLSDFTFLVSRGVTKDEVNDALKQAATLPKFKGILKVTEDQIVSSDIVGSTYSSIVDLNLTNVVDGDLVKIISWYDNEWGYSSRLVEFALSLFDL